MGVPQVRLLPASSARRATALLLALAFLAAPLAAAAGSTAATTEGGGPALGGSSSGRLLTGGVSAGGRDPGPEPPGGAVWAQGVGPDMRVPSPLPDGDQPGTLAVTPPGAAPRAPLAAPANWTVLVYMVADNDLEPYGIQDLNEMEAAPDNPDVHVVVEVDRSARYDTSNGDWSTTQRLEVRHDTDPSNIGSLFLADLGEQNMGDPQTLADFLVWGVDAYPADHYLVVLWDHGYGWSGGIGNDLGNGDHLNITELGSALTVGAEHLGRPFDVIAFDACLMQQVEVLYELAWVGDTFVAAEDLEPASGWPYEEMLGALYGAAGGGAREVASALAAAYMDYYGTQGETMMSAVDARELRTGLAASLNRLAADLAALVEDPDTMGQESLERAIWNARDQAPAMFITDYIDLGDFARRLEGDGRLPEATRAAAAGVRSALNLTVFQESHSVHRPGLTGITTYLPATSVPLRYTETDWATDSLWDEFIVAYLSGVPLALRIPTLTVSTPADGVTVARSFTGSFSATQQGAQPLQLQVKVAWGPWTPFANGSGNLSATGSFDAGPVEGDRTVSFRAVAPGGAPSPTNERTLHVVADPVALDPRPESFVLAQNRTATVAVNATLRDPFTAFTVGWRNLPPGVTNAGQTTFTPSPAGAPVSVPLVLAASPTAGPGGRVVAVFSPSGAPGLETVLPLDLVVTQPRPDLAVSPLVLDKPQPWPGDLVNVTATVSNIGFEDVAGARVVGTVSFEGGNVSERLNQTIGPLAQGEGLEVTLNWTVQLGRQTVSLRVDAVPAVVELGLANNERSVGVNMTPFGLTLVGPAGPVPSAGPGADTTVALELANVGTQGDNYTVAATVVSNESAWGLSAPGAAIPLAARTSTTVPVIVTTPASPTGGEALVIDVTVASLGQPGLDSTVRVTVVYPQVHAGSVHTAPDDVEVPAGGNTTVSVTLANEGNGPERYTLLLQNGDPSLEVTAPATVFDLAAGGVAAFNLTLRDAGLVSADRPYALEVVAVAQGTGDRLTGLVSVRVEPRSALSVQPIERTIEADPAQNTTFHVNVTNTGNTYAVVALSASSADPALEGTLPTGGVLLAPGVTEVVSGTARFAPSARAGEYTLTVGAADTRGPGNSSANLTLVVPAVHGFAALPASAPQRDPTPGTFVRSVRVDNHGNVDESLLLVIGFVPVGLTVTIEPSSPTLLVAAFSNATFQVRFERAAGPPASGQVEILVTTPGGEASDTVTVAYSFPGAAEDASLLWGATLGGVVAATVAWLWVTRPPRKS